MSQTQECPPLKREPFSGNPWALFTPCLPRLPASAGRYFTASERELKTTEDGEELQPGEHL